MLQKRTKTTCWVPSEVRYLGIEVFLKQGHQAVNFILIKQKKKRIRADRYIRKLVEMF